MRQDEVLYRIADKVKNFCVIYVCDVDQVPDFNQMYGKQQTLDRLPLPLPFPFPYVVNRRLYLDANEVTLRQNCMTLAPSCFFTETSTCYAI